MHVCSCNGWVTFVDDDLSPSCVFPIVDTHTVVAAIIFVSHGDLEVFISLRAIIHSVEKNQLEIVENPLNSSWITNSDVFELEDENILAPFNFYIKELCCVNTLCNSICLEVYNQRLIEIFKGKKITYIDDLSHLPWQNTWFNSLSLHKWFIIPCQHKLI